MASSSAERTWRPWRVGGSTVPSSGSIPNATTSTPSTRMDNSAGVVRDEKPPTTGCRQAARLPVRAVETTPRVSDDRVPGPALQHRGTGQMPRPTEGQRGGDGRDRDHGPTAAVRAGSAAAPCPDSKASRVP